MQLQSAEKVQQTLNQLSNQSTVGHFEFQYARCIYRARTSGRIHGAHTFFACAESSFLDEALLALSNLIFPHPDSIGVEYLLNCAEQTPEALSSANKDALMWAIANHRGKLQLLKQSAAKIQELRDRVIAHLDKKWVKGYRV